MGVLPKNLACEFGFSPLRSRFVNRAKQHLTQNAAITDSSLGVVAPHQALNGTLEGFFPTLDVNCISPVISVPDAITTLM